MSSTEIQSGNHETGRATAKRSSLRFAPVTAFFPVKCGADGLGIHELDRLRGFFLARLTEETESNRRSKTRSPGYVRNYAADEMNQTVRFEKILMAALAIGGVASIWIGAHGMTDLLTRWTSFVDLVGSVLH